MVIHVLADQAAIDAGQAALDTTQAAARHQDLGTAILSGTDMLPTPVLADLLRNGAKLRPLCGPDEDPEPGYRPSAKLARHIRARI